MQDPHTPPQEEVSTDGAVGVVRKNAAPVQDRTARARNIREFSPRLWITAIAPISTAPATTATKVPGGPVFPPPTRLAIRSRSPLRPRMRPRASSLLWKI